MTLFRIYFDANESSGPLYDLGITGSLRDIAPIADKLKEGMRIIIYMTGEHA